MEEDEIRHVWIEGERLLAEDKNGNIDVYHIINGDLLLSGVEYQYTLYLDEFDEVHKYRKNGL